MIMDSAIKKQNTVDIPTPKKGGKYLYYKKAFFYAIILGSIIMLPFVIYEWIGTGHPIFLFFGDYNAQQIPFYEHCVEMVRSGSLRWDWLTDLGANFTGTYSYYLLGSPFFWLMCLFPSTWAPYLMAPIYILKYGCASLVAYTYLKRFVKKQDYAVLGGLLYAFCGFQIYNTFFNQFHEVVVLFPLLLIGMEELVQNDRRGIFAVAVAVNAMCNYFMFAGQVVFCIIYFLIRIFDKNFKITFKKFLLMAFESVVGVLLSAILFLPAAVGVMDNPRLDRVGYDNLADALFWQKSDGGITFGFFGKQITLYTKRYGHILQSLFFPPDIASRTNFYYGHETRWASNAAWIPMFGLTGVFAFFRRKKQGTWLKVLCAFLAVCCLVPVLNSMFFLFNTSYYARWVYMLVLMFVVATIVALDDAKTNWKGSVWLHSVLCAAIAIPVGFCWTTADGKTTMSSTQFFDRYWVTVLITAISLGLVWYFIKYVRGTSKEGRIALIMTGIIICVYGINHIIYGKCHSYSSDFLIGQAITGEVELEDPEEEFYRTDFYRSSSISTLDNLSLYWGYPGVECFNTIVPASIMTFYPVVGVTRSVGSRAEASKYGLKAFLSVKYSFIVEGKKDKHNTVGFVYKDTQNGFAIYENEYYLNMGFTYDEFMVESEFEKYTKSVRHSLLCTYLVVPDDMADYYSQFMKEVKFVDGAKSGESTYKNSVLERQKNTCDDFEYNSKGFKASIELDKPNVVFFSVPADRGWSATVNGKAVDVNTATYGFVAVECEAGENQIEFTYNTPGFSTGAIVTLCGALILGVYLVISKYTRKEKKGCMLTDDYYEQI